MSNTIRNNLICPDDKDVYTTLQNLAIPNNSIEMLFLNHLTLTKRSDREYQAKKFSTSVLSYYDYLFLKEIFQRKRKRKETTKGILLKTDLTKTKIKDALEVEVQKLKDINNTVDIKIIPTSNKVSIKIDYIVFDFSKNLFNGQENLSTEIIINQKEDNAFFIESTNDKIIDRWQRGIIKVIQEKSDQSSFKEIEISLFGIRDQEKKLKFYSDLMENIPGFIYETVVDVFVSRKKEEKTDPEEENEDQTTEDVNRYIKKASFKGSKLLDSQTILELLREHYHIYKIVWQSKHSERTNEFYQFEVKFNIPEDCTDFAYSVHGKFVDGITKISTITPEETKEITNKIFQKAKELMETINQELRPVELPLAAMALKNNE